MILRKDTVDLAQILDEVVSVVSPLKAPGVQLTTSCSAVCSKIVGDEARWKQVLLNLATNALHFTPEGFVHISVLEIGKNMLEVRVPSPLRRFGWGG